jgi:alcohol dehydrogenase (cytochrome c)
LGGTIKPDPTASGWVVAVDSETGAVRWRFHADKPVIAGITPTAGGVIFTGDTAGHFLVLDSKTGLVLKQLDTGGALAGGVVTYEIGGKQYVAFASGNVSRVTFGELGLPSVIIMALGGKTALPAAAPRQGGTPGAPNPDHGHALYAQVCSTCHGAGGNLIEGHNLATLRGRRSLESTVAFIKAPVPPMPKLYPSTLGEQDVADLAAYLQQGGWK